MSIAEPTPSQASPAFVSRLPFALCGAAASAASLYAAPNVAGLFGALLAFLMAMVAWHDARAYVIPDRYSAAAFALAFAAIAFIESGDLLWSAAMALARAAILALCFFTLRALYHRFRGRHGLGLGDVKLAAVAGAWLDWTMLPVAIEMAALAALATVLTNQVITGQRFKLTARLPFGLFLAPAIWIGWLLQTILPGP
jgi:leader peptidase (prepilin peptidase)/N-methyltransferase